MGLTFGIFKQTKIVEFESKKKLFKNQTYHGQDRRIE